MTGEDCPVVSDALSHALKHKAILACCGWTEDDPRWADVRSHLDPAASP